MVDGVGSTWTIGGRLVVGVHGTATLDITGGGLVSVADKLFIDKDGTGLVNMSTGGMLALKGQADDSLASFLELIGGLDAIHYRPGAGSAWLSITDATDGQDYTLTYVTEGDLAGYTVLTVGQAR